MKIEKSRLTIMETRMPLVRRFIVLMLLSLCYAQTAAADGMPERKSPLAPKPVQKGLEPEKVDQIQVIGKAVLATRRGHPQSPAMAKLRQHVEELRQELINITGAPNHGGKTPLVADSALEYRIHAAMGKLRKQREAVEFETQASVAERDHTLERNAAAKVRELEDEVENALQSPAEERGNKLMALRERLKIGPRPVNPGKSKTPGIRTIANQEGEQQ